MPTLTPATCQRMYAIRWRFGDRSATLYEAPLWDVTTCRWVPSIRTEYRPPSQSSPRQLTYSSRWPSGVNRGQKSSDRRRFGVSCTALEPSASATQIVKSPLTSLTYAIFVPSGDQSPEKLTPSVVTWSSEDPSGLTV